MRPRKAKEFIPDVAEKTGLSEELVADMLAFYWREVRKNLSGLTEPRIHLENLGSFVIKHWKVPDKIAMLERFEENNKQKGMQQMTARFKTAEHLYQLKNLQQIMDEEQKRKEVIKSNKTTTDESKREHNQSMEEQSPDPGGSN